jgi:hypothetical protein
MESIRQSYLNNVNEVHQEMKESDPNTIGKYLSTYILNILYILLESSLPNSNLIDQNIEKVNFKMNSLFIIH